MKKILIIILHLLICLSCERQPWPPDGNRVCEVCNGMKGDICMTCMGTGREICSQCKGWGTVKVYNFSTQTYDNERCPTCHGIGRFQCHRCNGHGYKTPCPRCNGKGYVPRYPTIEDTY